MPPESDGIRSNAFGRSSATTISHTRAVRLSILQPVAPEDFGSPTCACRPPQSVFGHSPESSDSTGSSYPRLLRKCGLCVSHGLFGAYQNAFGCSPGISPLGSWGCKAPLGFAARTAECEELRFFTREASAFHRQASARHFGELRFSAESFGFPTCVMTAKRASPDLTEASGLHESLSRFRCQLSKVTASAVTESLQRPIVRGILRRTVHRF